jgi:MFS family permease
MPVAIFRARASDHPATNRPDVRVPPVLTNPVRLLAGLPATVRLLVIGTFVNKLGTFIMPYLTLVLQRELHLPAKKVGLVLAAQGVGSLAAILVGGLLTDRLGRRTTLMLSLFGSGALAIGMGLAASLTIFVTLLVGFGFLADLYRPAASAIIADVLPSAQRAVGFAGLRAAVNLGFSFGVALGGLIADWDWRVLFFADGFTTLLFGVIVYRKIRETRPPRPHADEAPATASESPWRDGVFLQLASTSLVFSMVLYSFFTVLPLTITLSAGYPAAVYGSLLAVNGVLIAAFEMSVVNSLRRFARLRVAGFGLLLTGLGFALTGFVLHWAWFLLSILVWTTGEILTGPQQTSFVADWAPPAARGRYLSVYQATWSLAVILNPLVLLPLHAWLPEHRFWPLLSVVTVPPALLLLRLARLADRPELLRGRSVVSPAV